MDPNSHHQHHQHVPSRFNRLLGPYSHASATTNDSPDGVNLTNGDLNEDDIFSVDLPLSSPSSLSGAPRTPRRIERSLSGFKAAEISGILAALPESASSSGGRNHQHHHVFHHKSAAAPLSTSVSSTASSYSSSSSARAIPSVPKPPQDRLPFSSSSSSSGKYHQSAPVNVPVMLQQRRRREELDLADDDDGEEEEEGEMLPPHEIVARSLAQSPRLSSSVLEGAGRTLKGRDLRQVRNAVFRQIGFID